MRPRDRNDPYDHTRRGAARPRRVLVCALLMGVSALSGVGCRAASLIGKPDTKYDLLTAELRTRERELEEARAERDQLRLLTHAYQRQVSQQPPVCDTTSTPAGAPTLPLRDFTLGTGTGGVDSDGLPGDESFMVVVVPKDDDGTTVKVPAKVTVTAFEVSPQGIKSPIGRWEVPPEQLRRTWRSGLLSSGYFVPLQWDKPPATDRVRVVARLTTLDGRDYEADKEVRVQPLTGTNAVPPPAVPDQPVPRGAEELPAPAARLKPARALP